LLAAVVAAAFAVPVVVFGVLNYYCLNFAAAIVVYTAAHYLSHNT
jgi:hypothetical protein